ncbi:MAG: VOC family protein [Polyangiales bacterium]
MTRRVRSSDGVLTRVLRELGVPHIEDRLPREFFYRLELAFPQQYGIACRDVATCVRRAESLGAGPFLHTKIKPPNWIERGERLDCTLEFALGYAGDAQIEFLGPGHGTDHYARALVDNDITLHHVGIYQRGMNRIAETLETSGYPTAVTGGLSLGPALNIDFRYFDARHAHDLYLEILDFRLLGLSLSTEPAIRLQAALKRTLRRKGDSPL